MPDFCWMTTSSWPFGCFTSIGDAEKSKSGPSFAGQFGLSGGFVGRQPPAQTSLASGCCDHSELAGVHVEREHGVAS